jgi:Fic family protein
MKYWKRLKKMIWISDITRWIIWFFQQVDSAAQAAMILLSRINSSTKFWDQHRHTVFNPIQQKLLQKMLEEGAFSDGISRKKYKKLVSTSDITAARDLQDLIEKKISCKPEGQFEMWFMVLCMMSLRVAITVLENTANP